MDVVLKKENGSVEKNVCVKKVALKKEPDNYHLKKVKKKRIFRIQLFKIMVRNKKRES